MTTLEAVLDNARRSGVPVDELVVGAEPDVVPQAPSHRWVLLPMSDGTVAVGGTDRGRFAPYGRTGDPETLEQTLRRLTEEPELPPLGRPVRTVLSATRGLADRLRAKNAGSRPLTPGDLPAGSVFDHIGPECGHVLYLFATPFDQRSLPPSDLNLPRTTGYVLDGQLPGQATVEELPPGFGQPGGGIAVRLPRVIRHYCDTGLLVRFDPSLGD